MTHTIEVGDWRSGTQCVPLHERKTKETPSAHQPPSCPRTDLDDYKPDAENEKWHYDSHLMSKIYGQHQHEWYKRMMMGYGVQKLKLSSGVSHFEIKNCDGECDSLISECFSVFSLSYTL